MNPLIDTPAQIERLVHALEAGQELAVDTEADSLHCYFEKLCLIQITSDDGANYLVDPLAGLDLQPLLDLFQRKTLIFHAADFDLRMLKSAGAYTPGRIFDTSVAARLLGYRELGLAAIAQGLLGVTLVKHSQRENWALRPLPQKMVDYAINDTRHLHALKRILEARLAEKGRMPWLDECCERLITSAMQEKQRDEENAWRITGHARLSPRVGAILRELWLWRDEAARKRDRPSFHVLRNEDLIKAAEAFEKGEGFDSSQLRGDARRIFNDVGRRASGLPEDKWPERIRRPRPKPFTDEQEARLVALRKVREERARDLDLDPSVIAPRAALERVAANPACAQSSLMRWQQALLGIADPEHGA